ncbi:hypothetical protein N181_23260 [Sinorhizobium fredii USDA 205]|uniref:Uncharacterized protein n=1 Tax=Rhizobium fredii TaxID=380 RepID=A0A844A140_RHIFR|nr:hypothetical protein [Sinorhizobium fredii]KSV85580.1 hypothetical protein N181_23260 [Sinorhizobium fredii USDA 205]MQX06784.1 hypothetical protein [Sinorhizobium fredii]GEC34041.1 hypothetical protein EFR01_42120 [Sinorhizobium fredii]GLS06417.1 hypothetical protein GCM10007864_00410 [Sinorhizobium fredii]
MARRILSAELDWMIGDSVTDPRHSPIKLDEQVDIDWKFRIGIDHESGALASSLPPYDVKFLGKRIGTLTDPDEIKWVRQATDADPEAGAVGRINEIILSDNQRQITGFKVEVLTGVDAKALKLQNEYQSAKQTLVTYWWVIPVILLLIWWQS